MVTPPGIPDLQAAPWALASTTPALVGFCSTPEEE